MTKLNRLFRTQPISLRFSLQSFTMGCFELSLFWSFLRFPWELETGGGSTVFTLNTRIIISHVNLHCGLKGHKKIEAIIVLFCIRRGKFFWNDSYTLTQSVWSKLTRWAQCGWTQSYSLDSGRKTLSWKFRIKIKIFLIASCLPNKRRLLVVLETPFIDLVFHRHVYGTRRHPTDNRPVSDRHPSNRFWLIFRVSSIVNNLSVNTFSEIFCKAFHVSQMAVYVQGFEMSLAFKSSNCKDHWWTGGSIGLNNFCM